MVKDLEERLEFTKKLDLIDLSSELPLEVPGRISSITSFRGPVDPGTFVKIGSSEQSFLYVYEQLEKNKGYLATTKCWRPEDEGKPYCSTEFLKTEFFSPEVSQNFTPKYLATEVKKNYEKLGLRGNYSIEDIHPPEDSGLCRNVFQLDLMKDGVELGSFGIRSFEEKSWMYGTLFSHYRFDVLMREQEKGYHLEDIPKGNYGEISKIEEELRELQDAAVQQCKILEAVELSDLYGALEGYCETLGLTMEDLKKMSDITKRAFRSGRR